MASKILVLNSGSSSIKYQLFDMPAGTVSAHGIVEKIGENIGRCRHVDAKGEREEELPVVDHRVGLQILLKYLTAGNSGSESATLLQISAVGHRVVHGGEAFTSSVLVTPDVEKAIENYSNLAPLHNPSNLIGIRAAREFFPTVPQVACFDTSFHSSLPEIAYLYGLPYELYEKYRVRRYGFHGISHRYVAGRAAELLGKKINQVNLITCHLGNGCSMAAIQNGRSVDTSMGLTPLEGLVMGTRCGDIDPAIIFFLAEKFENAPLTHISDLMNKKSGLLGLSGLSNDMRTLLQAAHDGNRRAALAIDIFAYRIKKYLGAYAAILPPLDAIVFTGGIGENASAIRAKSVDGLDANFGIKLDQSSNVGLADCVEGEISASGSRVKVMVIPTNEEKAIALDTYEIAVSQSGL